MTLFTSTWTSYKILSYSTCLTLVPIIPLLLLPALSQDPNTKHPSRLLCSGHFYITSFIFTTLFLQKGQSRYLTEN